MNKMEVIKEMMNSENGGLYAAITGIVVVYGLDRITKSRYRVEAKKESLTVAPDTESAAKLNSDKSEGTQ